jgi:hypothetical protein
MLDVQTVSDKIVDDDSIKISFDHVLQYMFSCYDTVKNKIKIGWKWNAFKK